MRAIRIVLGSIAKTQVIHAHASGFAGVRELVVDLRVRFEEFDGWTAIRAIGDPGLGFVGQKAAFGDRDPHVTLEALQQRLRNQSGRYANPASVPTNVSSAMAEAGRERRDPAEQHCAHGAEPYATPSPNTRSAFR